MIQEGAAAAYVWAIQVIDYIHKVVYFSLLGVFRLKEQDQSLGLLAVQLASCWIVAALVILPISFVAYNFIVKYWFRRAGKYEPRLADGFHD